MQLIINKWRTEASSSCCWSSFCQLSLPLFLYLVCPLTPLNIPQVNDLVLGEVVYAVGRWPLFPPAPYSGDTSETTLLHISYKDVWTPWVVSLCAGASHFSPLGRNAAVRRLAILRDQEQEVDSLLCADSRQADSCQRPSWQRHWLPPLPFWQYLANQND